MDDHGSCKATRQFVRVAGVKFIFLPKYSPDLNLVEQMIFAKRKPLLRKALHASSKRSAQQLLECPLTSPANAQMISEFFRLCVNLTAIMHNRARGIKKDASEQHTWEKQKGFGVANHLSIAL
jgi:hypothetical protein